MYFRAAAIGLTILFIVNTFSFVEGDCASRARRWAGCKGDPRDMAKAYEDIVQEENGEEFLRLDPIVLGDTGHYLIIQIYYFMSYIHLHGL